MSTPERICIQFGVVVIGAIVSVMNTIQGNSYSVSCKSGKRGTTRVRFEGVRAYFNHAHGRK